MTNEEAIAIAEKYAPTINRAVTVLSEVDANELIGNDGIVKAVYVTRELSRLPPSEVVEELRTGHSNAYALLVGAVTPCESGWTIQISLDSILILDTAEKPIYFQIEAIVDGVAKIARLRGFKYDRKLHAKTCIIRNKASQTIFDREAMSILARPNNRHKLN